MVSHASTHTAPRHPPAAPWRAAGRRPRRAAGRSDGGAGGARRGWRSEARARARAQVYIGNEIRALLGLDERALSVRAHRVGVHIGHFVDVRDW